jgi:two-component system copper resistance phosphate regulon response regulator CusR
MTVDMVRRTVIRSGKKIHLTGKEYVLLELLLQRTGEVLPRVYLVPGLEHEF